MKVWVPIDLPVDHKVDSVTIQSIPKNALEVRIIGSIRPIGPFRRMDDEAMERPTEPKRDRWEYRVYRNPTLDEPCQLGAKGWEMVTGVGTGDGTAIYFKRRLP